MDRDDLITVTFTKYKEKNPRWWRIFRRMSWPILDRFALDFGYYSVIIELWFLRKGTK